MVKKKFVSLQPDINEEVDKNNLYMDTLDWALKEKDIKNLAITGSFGSGKSTIIQKFISKNAKDKNRSKGYNFFQVSLASFDGIDIDNENIVNKIEEGVLQQLFYQVSGDDIPYSRFKKIKHVKKRHIIVYNTLSMTIIVTLAIILEPARIFLINDILNNFSEIGIVPIFSVSIMLVFSLLFTYSFFKISQFFIRKLKLSKLTLDKAGLEITNKREEESIFNKYLDEILYFFEATVYNVIIFEDLDRFKNNQIFIELREINSIINRYSKIKRKIVFIYAIKDDMFHNRERTKFFDFILPIIPFINSSNSYEILTRKIREIGLSNKQISDEFILDISSFIDDMRLLNNIINEFIIYHEKILENTDKSSEINTLNIDKEMLLAIIIYKNICPNDFAELQYHKGLVYNTLNYKDSFSKALRKEIKGYRNKVNIAKSQIINNLEELSYVLENVIRKQIGEVSYNIKIYYDFIYLNVLDFVHLEIDFTTLTDIEIRYTKYSEINTLADSNTTKFINKLGNKKYAIRENSMLNNYEQKIKDKTKMLEELEILSTRQIAEQYGLEYDCKYEDDVYEVAKFMLRRGYIDETYENYISHFHEGSLKAEDNNYILNLKREKPLEYTYKLSNVTMILNRLNKRDFLKKNYFNIYLSDFLLQHNNQGEYKYYYNCLMEHISDSSEESKSFLKKWIRHTKDNELLIRNSASLWSWFYDWVINEENINSKEFLYIILKYNTIKEICKLNQKGNVKDMIIQLPDIWYDTPHVEIAKWKEIITELELKFEELNIHEDVFSMDPTNCDIEYKEVLEYIFENKYFALTMSMFKTIGKYYFDNSSEFRRRNLSMIRNSEYKWLIGMIDNNIETYITDIFLKYGDNDTENKDTILYLMEHENLTKSIKEQILVKEIYVFDTIDMLPSNYWVFSFKNKIISINWENIKTYVNEFSYDSFISEFISKNSDILKNASDTANKKLITKIINDKAIEVNVLENLETIIKQWYFNATDLKNFNDMQYNKIDFLIKNNLLYFSSLNYNALKKLKEPILSVLFFEVGFENQSGNFEKEVVDFNFRDTDLNLLFKNRSISLEHKKVLLKHLDLSIIKNIDTLNIIATFVTDNCVRQDINIDQLNAVLQSSITDNIKINLLNSKIGSLSDSEIIKLLNSSKGELKKLALFRQQPKFEDNAINKEFTKFLFYKGFVGKHKIRNNRIVVSTVDLSKKF